MLTWTRFTKFDWDAMAGATRFANGDEPWTAEGTVDGDPACFVLDSTGIGVYVERFEDGAEFWYTRGDSPTQVEPAEEKLVWALNAVLALEPVTTAEELRRLGFVKDGDPNG